MLLANECQICHFLPWPVDNPFNFDWIFLKHAGNQDRHKIWDKFKFRPDRNIRYGVTCPWEHQKPIFDLFWAITSSFFIRLSSNIQITRTGIKYQWSSSLGQIVIFALELHALRWRNFIIHFLWQNVVQLIAPSVFIRFLSNYMQKGFKDLEFRPDRTIHVGVTCPWVPKKPIFDIFQSMVPSVFVGSSSKLKLTRIGIKISNNRNQTWVPLRAMKTFMRKKIGSYHVVSATKASSVTL